MVALPEKRSGVELEHQSDTELNYASGQGDVLEIGEATVRNAGIIQNNVWQITGTRGIGGLGVDAVARIGVIQDVVGLSPQLEFYALANLGVLENAHVELVDCRAMQVVARHIAKRRAENLGRTWGVDD